MVCLRRRVVFPLDCKFSALSYSFSLEPHVGGGSFFSSSFSGIQVGGAEWRACDEGLPSVRKGLPAEQERSLSSIHQGRKTRGRSHTGTQHSTPNKHGRRQGRERREDASLHWASVCMHRFSALLTLARCLWTCRQRTCLHAPLRSTLSQAILRVSSRSRGRRPNRS